MKLPGLDDLDVAGKRVLVRCDLNVPLRDGAIVDDLRIRAARPTLETLLDKGAKVAVCSHLGRPGGKVVDDLRLEPVGKRLEQALNRPVDVLREVVGQAATEACASSAEVVLLENLRFEPGETSNDPVFADQLAALADAFVNDAFGAAHRAHASVVGVAARLPSAAGHLLSTEVSALERVLNEPARPFVAVLGGAKVSDKLAVIGHLLERVDALCVGGAMAFTLLVAQGHAVGRSLVEAERVEEVRQVLDQAAQRGVEILIPSDVVAADSPEAGSPSEMVPLYKIADRFGVDIGEATASAFSEVISTAATVLWNGPMGIFEVPEFSYGTSSVANAVVQATNQGAYTVVGGGDSAAALKALGLAEGVSHLSTGGGASLEFLEGKDLPGVGALMKSQES